MCFRCAIWSHILDSRSLHVVSSFWVPWINFSKCSFEQECIPVGCVPPAAVTISWGVCLSACWDTHPARCGPGDLPLGVGLETPQGWAWRPPWVWAWRPPRPDPWTPPWVWAWRPPRPDHSRHGMLGYTPLDTCKACWDTICKACWDTTPLWTDRHV